MTVGVGHPYAGTCADDGNSVRADVIVSAVVPNYKWRGQSVVDDVAHPNLFAAACVDDAQDLVASLCFTRRGVEHPRQFVIVDVSFCANKADRTSKNERCRKAVDF